MFLIVVIAAGCTGQSFGVDSLVKSSPQVKAFLAEYPNAKLTTNLLGNDSISGQLEQIREQCDNNDVKLYSYYKTVLTDPDSNTKLTVWTNSASLETVCMVREAINQKPQSIPVETTTTLVPTTAAFTISSTTFPASSTTTLPASTVTPDLEFPTIKGSMSPSNPARGQPFNLTIDANDDRAIKSISWTSSKPIQNYGQSGSFDCNNKKPCSNTWIFTSNESGIVQFSAVAADSSGKESSKLSFEANIQTFEYKPPTTTTISATTTTKATTTTVSSEECSSKSDCGYKQICSNKKCVDVECTTDSQCSGCKRCSSNSCVSCGRGPYGCYC
ncbi:MAG: hypothetical protein HY362_03415 [Candidatus Aenigmarchaeota archaeon]|nr:hypothetical protein [Candidatus Aenigmarchaeota archaeon]